MRLGFPVRVIGRAGLKAYDSRRTKPGPHLSVSLVYLRDILLYLSRCGIKAYRMAAEILPSGAAGESQWEDCRTEMAAVGALAREHGIRLSLHAGPQATLSAPDEAGAARTLAELDRLARLLDGLQVDGESVLVAHVGGAYDNAEAALTRCAAAIHLLPESTRARLALENDDTLFDVTALYRVHQRCGVPIVFDPHHHLLHNAGGLDLSEALALSLDTWPEDRRPKVHFSSPRLELREAHVSDPETGERRRVLRPPQLSQHADFVNPFEFASFLRLAEGRRVFDVMVEARARDLAVLRLRADLDRYAPEVAAMVEAPAALQEAEGDYAAHLPHPLPDDEARVLVAVITRPKDLQLAQEQGWYRIPVRRAPGQLGADYLALYQTGAFGPEGGAVNYYAPVARYRLGRRRDFLPDEVDHPRADELYWWLKVERLQRLPRSLPSQQPRLTFIPTTLDRLLNARQVSQLWVGPARPQWELAADPIDPVAAASLDEMRAGREELDIDNW